MDPIHYDRISDLLCQIRAKVENNLRTTHKKGEFTKQDYIIKVYDLIKMTDALYELDKNGML
tara:strand:- start:113 stop:298 length:186 start_codon:yes stop_codon:yes gene_type:complete